MSEYLSQVTRTVNLVPGTGFIEPIILKRGDTARRLVFNIYEGVNRYVLPVGVSVKLEGTRADGGSFSLDCEKVDGSTNTVAVIPNMTTTKTSGKCRNAELRIYDATGKNIGTKDIPITVNESGIPAGATIDQDITPEEHATLMQQVTSNTAKIANLDERLKAIEEGGVGVDQTAIDALAELVGGDD